MRIRDHSTADLALTALTLAVAAAGAVVEVTRRVRGGRREPPSRHPERDDDDHASDAVRRP